MNIVDIDSAKKEEPTAPTIKEHITSMMEDIHGIDEVGDVILITVSEEEGAMSILSSGNRIENIGKLEIAKKMMIEG